MENQDTDRKNIDLSKYIPPLDCAIASLKLTTNNNLLTKLVGLRKYAISITEKSNLTDVKNAETLLIKVYEKEKKKNCSCIKKDIIKQETYAKEIVIIDSDNEDNSEEFSKKSKNEIVENGTQSIPKVERVFENKSVKKTDVLTNLDQYLEVIDSSDDESITFENIYSERIGKDSKEKGDENPYNNIELEEILSDDDNLINKPNKQNLKENLIDISDASLSNDEDDCIVKNISLTMKDVNLIKKCISDINNSSNGLQKEEENIKIDIDNENLRTDKISEQLLQSEINREEPISDKTKINIGKGSETDNSNNRIKKILPPIPLKDPRILARLSRSDKPSDNNVLEKVTFQHQQHFKPAVDITNTSNQVQLISLHQEQLQQQQQFFQNEQQQLQLFQAQQIHQQQNQQLQQQSHQQSLDQNQMHQSHQQLQMQLSHQQQQMQQSQQQQQMHRSHQQQQIQQSQHHLQMKQSHQQQHIHQAHQQQLPAYHTQQVQQYQQMVPPNTLLHIQKQMDYYGNQIQSPACGVSKSMLTLQSAHTENMGPSNFISQANGNHLQPAPTIQNQNICQSNLITVPIDESSPTKSPILQENTLKKCNKIHRKPEKKIKKLISPPRNRINYLENTNEKLKENSAYETITSPSINLPLRESLHDKMYRSGNYCNITNTFTNFRIPKKNGSITDSNDTKDDSSKKLVSDSCDQNKTISSTHALKQNIIKKLNEKNRHKGANARGKGLAQLKKNIIDKDILNAYKERMRMKNNKKPKRLKIISSDQEEKDDDSMCSSNSNLSSNTTLSTSENINKRKRKFEDIESDIETDKAKEEEKVEEEEFYKKTGNILAEQNENFENNTPGSIENDKETAKHDLIAIMQSKETLKVCLMDIKYDEELKKRCVQDAQLLTPIKEIAFQENKCRSKKIKVSKSSNVTNTNRNNHCHSRYVEKCLICGKSITAIVSHYVNQHKLNEVMISRLSERDIELLLKYPLYVVGNNAVYTLDCIFCDKKFNFTLKNWYKHYSSHTGEFPYRCSECEFLCVDKDEMREHIHTECSENGKITSYYTFDTKSHGVTAYFCTLCNYVQIYQENVFQHLKTQHHCNRLTEVFVRPLILFGIESSAANTVNEQCLIEPTIQQPSGVNYSVNSDDSLSKYFKHSNGKKQNKKKVMIAKRTSKKNKSKKHKPELAENTEENITSVTYSDNSDECVDVEHLPEMEVLKKLEIHDYPVICNEKETNDEQLAERMDQFMLAEQNAIQDLNSAVLDMFSLPSANDELLCSVMPELTLKEEKITMERNYNENIDKDTPEQVDTNISNSTTDLCQVVANDEDQEVCEATQINSRASISSTQASYEMSMINSDALNGIAQIISNTSNEITETNIPNKQNSVDVILTLSTASTICESKNDDKLSNADEESGVEAVALFNSTLNSFSQNISKWVDNNITIAEDNISQSNNLDNIDFQSNRNPNEINAINWAKKLKPWALKTFSYKSEAAYKSLMQPRCLFSLYKCMGRDCSFASNSLENMQCHIDSHETTPEHRAHFECCYCESILSSSTHLIMHISEEHELNAFQCSECFYRSCSVLNVKYHQNERHSTIAHRKIVICSDKMKLPFVDINLIMKQRLSNVAEIKCPECCTLFYTKVQFLKHLHLNCNKRTALEDVLRKFRKYACIYCNYESNYLKEINQHIVYDHSDKYTFICIRMPNRLDNSLDEVGSVGICSTTILYPCKITSSSLLTYANTQQPLHAYKLLNILSTETYIPNDATNILNVYNHGNFMAYVESKQCFQYVHDLNMLFGNELEDCNIISISKLDVAQKSIEQLKSILNSVFNRTGYQGKNLYKCLICPRKFKLFEKWKKHIRRDHMKNDDKQLYMCCHCSDYYCLLDHFDHIDTHRKHNILCYWCGSTTNSIELAQAHYEKHSKMFPIFIEVKDNNEKYVIPSNRNDVLYIIIPKDITCAYATFIDHLEDVVRIQNCATDWKIKGTKVVYEPVPMHISVASNMKYVPIKTRYRCTYSYCNSNDLTESGLAEHLKCLHAKKKYYKCNFCKFSMITDGKYFNHVLHHLKFHDEYLYECLECNFPHYSRNIMLQHIYCFHSFKLSTMVIRRRKLLLKMKTCEIFQAINLNNSVDQSNSSSNYKCAWCPYLFKRREYFLRHIEFDHCTESMYYCPHCDFYDNRLIVLKSHLSIEHFSKANIVIRCYSMSKHKQDVEAVVGESSQSDLYPQETIQTAPVIMSSSELEPDELILPFPDSDFINTYDKLGLLEEDGTQVNMVHDETAVLTIQTEQLSNDIQNASVNSNAIVVEKNKEILLSPTNDENSESCAKLIPLVSKSTETSSNIPLSEKQSSVVETLSLLQETDETISRSPGTQNNFVADIKIQSLSSIDSSIDLKYSIETNKNNSNFVTGDNLARNNSETILNVFEPNRSSVDYSNIDYVTNTSSIKSSIPSLCWIEEKKPKIRVVPIEKLRDNANIELPVTSVMLEKLETSIGMKYLCFYCSLEFTKVNDVRYHWCYAHDPEPFIFKLANILRCGWCDYKSTFPAMKTHFQSNHILESFSIFDDFFPNKCGRCWHSVNSVSDLVQHTNVSHDLREESQIDVNLSQEQLDIILKFGQESNSYECPDCHQVFKQESLYKNHKPCFEYTQPLPICNPKETRVLSTCGVCYTTYAIKTKLEDHIRFHHLIYKCPFCNDTIGYLKEIEQHIMQMHPSSPLLADSLKPTATSKLLLGDVILFFPNGLSIKKKSLQHTSYGLRQFV